MYKNYIFDLYGTLIDINTNEWKKSLWKNMAMIYSMSGASYTGKELNKCYNDLLSKEIKRIPKKKYTTHPEPQIENVFKELYAQKGVKMSKEMINYTCRIFRSLSIQHIRLYDGAIELLKTIKEHGGNVYLLSNAQRVFTEPEIRMMGLFDLFDDILISSDEGCAKPDIIFYKCILDKYDLDPKESIMIGNDYITDIRGSNQAGMDSLYLHTNISPEIKGELLATYSVMDGSLIEARKILFGE